MKKLFLLVALFALTFGQNPNQKMQQSVLSGGTGLTWIDGKPYYQVTINPELSFSKVGIGLDLRLEFNNDGIRKENFNETSDYISIIRYFRYGYKGDPFYIRLGALDFVNLGNGTIISNYSNRPSIDSRKIGMELAFDTDEFGAEMLYGNFGMAGLAGLRAYIRPLKFTPMAEVPVLGNLEIGGSYVIDMDKRADFDSTVTVGNQTTTYGEKTLSAFGFDITLPIVKSSMVNLKAYYDFVKILNYGNGSALGAKLDITATDAFIFGTKFEYRINGDKYLPGYFNSFYEIERYNSYNIGNKTFGKARTLDNIKGKNGYFGELYASLAKVITARGSYERIPDIPKSGILHIDATANLGESYAARAGYDKINIDGEAAIFKTDENTVMFAEFGYKPYSFMLVSMAYIWNFTPVREGGKTDGKIIGYKPQKRIEPRVTFSYSF
ncbi:MAG TPA: hypothetical protein PLI27_02940 [Ignavibacteriales bacterium]|nr:hypothetical protein [Ignavibacteriales bacterium]HOL81493.1 hypothetical protein [Ignavibacteriales bacterium]HOM65391.1 hypothetical protein [Ignavibacteriales bacterium]HPD67020.1 hypothetical protein [Ignavibacteriales bacterium]HPP33580.1 hypothetical protein [Ignavibacteriales bacterium]